MNRSVTTNALVAVFRDRSSADRAKQQLLREGFDADQIEVTSSNDVLTHVATGGAALGGTRHDTSGGGISGFFARLFGDDTTEEDRRYYSDTMKRGDTAVVVHADERSIDRAADILNESGAIQVEDRSASTGVEERTTPVVDRGATPATGESTTIPVIREDLQVGKRALQRGGVRVHSTVSERPVEEQVQLREERVRVDRRPADRPATDADIAAADREVIEVNETVEEPVISKSARVVEEVVVSKDVRQRTETVRDRVQRSDVKVEDARTDRGTTSRETAYGGSTTDYDQDFREDFRTRYNNSGSYDEYQPAYHYGYEMAGDPRYRGRNFGDVEETLRTDYLRRNPGSTWDRAKGAIRYGWEKVSGKR